MRVTKRITAWIGCFLMAGYVSAQQADAVFGPRQARGAVDNPEINEASGLVASVAHKGCFWTHNDSGDDARIFLIDDSARYRATYYLEGVAAHDWEDIAMMEQEGCHYLLIGDIGDNRGERPYIHVHILKEPSSPVQMPTVDTLPGEQIRSFVLRYEDGPRDAESLFFDAVDHRLYVVSKRELEVGVYAAVLPESTADTLTLHRRAVLPHVFITSAAISPDGTEVLLKNLLQVFYWKRKPGESIAEMFSRPAALQPYHPEPQGEAIAFAPGNGGFYTLGEAVLGMRSILYFYPRF